MFDEIRALLDLPGMGLAITVGPVVWLVIWLFLSVCLWRGGFIYLVEKLTRPRWAGAERARAVMLMPVRAVMLTLAAALAATITTVGLAFNLAIVISVIEAIRGGG